jgi:serine protease inhibitor
MALGMTFNGANGETDDAMRSSLRLDDMAETEINQGYRDLIALLTGLDSRTEVRIANSIWGHGTLAIEQPFTQHQRQDPQAAGAAIR